MTCTIRLFVDSKPKVKPKAGNNGNGQLSFTDDDLLNKAQNATNGARFKALYDDGDISGNNGDDSAADLSLMNLLAFLTNNDSARMETLFGWSALGKRDKWKRADYRQRTINEAIAGTKNTYRPLASGAKVHQAADTRPKIEINTERHLTVEAAIKAIAGDPDLFTGGAIRWEPWSREKSESVKLPGGVELQRPREFAVLAVVGSGLELRPDSGTPVSSSAGSMDPTRQSQWTAIRQLG